MCKYASERKKYIIITSKLVDSHTHFLLPPPLFFASSVSFLWPLFCAFPPPLLPSCHPLPPLPPGKAIRTTRRRERGWELSFRRERKGGEGVSRPPFSISLSHQQELRKCFEFLFSRKNFTVHFLYVFRHYLHHQACTCKWHESNYVQKNIPRPRGPKKVDWRSSSAHFLSPISVRGGERGERVRNAANVLSPVPLSPLSLFFFSLSTSFQSLLFWIGFAADALKEGTLCWVFIRKNQLKT